MSTNLGPSACSGCVAAKRRLESCGMRVSKVERCARPTPTWRAETDRGPRWISKPSGKEWTISKAPPPDRVP